jgi:hypothetical protein
MAVNNNKAYYAFEYNESASYVVGESCVSAASEDSVSGDSEAEIRHGKCHRVHVPNAQ